MENMKIRIAIESTLSEDKSSPDKSSGIALLLLSVRGENFPYLQLHKRESYTEARLFHGQIAFTQFSTNRAEDYKHANRALKSIYAPSCERFDVDEKQSARAIFIFIFTPL